MEDASYFSVYGFGTLKIYMLINTKLEKTWAVQVTLCHLLKPHLKQFSL